MKKRFFGIIVLAILLLGLAGCGSKTSGEQDANPGDAGVQENGQIGSQQNGPQGNFRGMGFSQSGVMGEVESVKENTITLKTIEMPARQENGNSGQGGNRQGVNPSERPRPSGTPPTNANQQDPLPPPENGGDPGSSQPPDAGNRQGGGMPNRGGFNFDRETLEYTGETVTISVDDQAVISSFAMNRNTDQQSNNLTLADIKSGDIIQVSYTDDTKTTVSGINIMSPAAE